MKKQGLYDPQYEHDACGVGFVVNIAGEKSHKIIQQGIHVLGNLLHRGAAGGDAKTGDGAGILVQMPDAFLRAKCLEIGIVLPAEGAYGLGMVFFPAKEDVRKKAIHIFERCLADEGATLLGWREVPVRGDQVGEMARRSQPAIMQCFVKVSDLRGMALERRLYVIRRVIEKAVEADLVLGDEFYIPSFSCRTALYKGMMHGPQVPAFYPDLLDPSFVSALAVIHQRYSTNTFPSWKLAHPFRYLAHNGEINTLRGNKNHMASRERSLASALFGADIKKLLPIVDETGSDSACLDNVLELLALGGRELPHAMMMLVPQAWGDKYPIGPDQRAFFEYHAGLMEPWDGPAAVTFTDGGIVGALLDRNGLRPCRYTVTHDNFMVLCSETGVLDFDPKNVRERGALRPGEILMVDLDQKRLIKDKEIKMHYARRRPYRRWVEDNRIDLRGLFGEIEKLEPDSDSILMRQRLFGYTREDLNINFTAMANKGAEPVGSMGYDAPLAVLSEKPQLLYSYFKQMFAQITNPPIDPIREELVMTLMTYIGNHPNILSEVPENSKLIKLMHPILSDSDLERIRAFDKDPFRTQTIPIGFPMGGDGAALANAIDSLCSDVEESVRSGVSIVILSDRNLAAGLSPIPALLAVSAVGTHLGRKGLRTSSGLIIETGEAREVQHFALLLGYGATAVHPYLAFESIAQMVRAGSLEKNLTTQTALDHFVKANCKGLRKVMSKMGISTLRSYRGAQVFEAVGLKSDLINRYFPGTSSRVEGIGLDEVAREVHLRVSAAYDPASVSSPVLPVGGDYRWRKDGERHLWTADAITKLQIATRHNDVQIYREYTKLINDQTRNQYTLRGLFRFKPTTAIPLSEVEPATELMKRFVSGAMSYGSISLEAHETLAIAMNRIGGKSNSGEGGEDPARYKLLPNGDSKSSAIKQVASARFGVTAEYLVNAKEHQIKIAQGAKPGEGGQLPGHKVNEEIARVRHSTPGVSLISPPPHHDIYSIEDIKQLIFDLRNVNPTGRVSVKLVSEVGVGTVAAGVAKASSDMVLISGYDGGTGASPLSSIKHAGAPWELGLAETQQTLMLNNLRDRIRVQCDGQLKTGRDAIIAALLGAEEFGFATTSLVVAGCIMMRKCHENICPVGVATQNPELRKRFNGNPDHVVNFFRFIAEDMREHMAMLGFRTLDDMVGHSELLEMNDAIDFWKAKGLDFSRIFYQPTNLENAARRCVKGQKHDLEKVLDKTLLQVAMPALEKKQKVTGEYAIKNVNLSTGAMLSGEIARRYGNAGLPDNTIHFTFRGSAGQSFGAFSAAGLTLELIGDANDYLGKGLSGARVIVRPPEGITYDPATNIIAGNVLLYGATSGELYVNGSVGERFGIRNSGAYTVVEGVGDHGCEYMTGGRVVVLGETGVNFAAGMSGGIAYVWDPTGTFDSRCNLTMVDLELMTEDADIQELRGMIERHLKYTGSRRASEILNNWRASLASFIKVYPMEYRKAMGQRDDEEDVTQHEEAGKAKAST